MKNLIIFYSREGENCINGIVRNTVKGNTEICVEIIRRNIEADIFRVETVKEYSKDYIKCTEEAKAEHDSNARPELKKYLDNLDEYKNVFVCGPCWWGTYPCAVFSLLEKLDWTGKRVIPLMTHEGSGLGTSVEDLKRICRGAEFGEPYAVHGAEAAAAGWPLGAWARNQIAE